MSRRAPPLPNVTWQKGTFEDLSLENASQKWVVAAQAFHWADARRSLPELRRVLQRGGHLSVLWNNRDNQANAVLDWTRRAVKRHVPDFSHAYRDADWPSVLTSTGDFDKAAYHAARHTVTMSRQRYLDLWRSHNRLNAIAGPVRFEEFLSDLVGYLDRGGIDSIDVAYDCRAWTVRRRDEPLTVQT